MSVLDVGFHIKPPTSQEFPIYETMSSLRYDSRGNRFSVHTESKDIIFPAGSVGPPTRVPGGMGVRFLFEGVDF
jgi:hypothetical protein